MVTKQMNKQLPLNDFYDIYGTWHTPWWQTKAFYSVCLILICVLLASGIYYLFKRYRHKQSLVKPWDRAVAQLRVIQKETHDTGQSGQLYATITAVLKNYLHERYGFDLVGMTDQEVLVYLAEVDFPKDLLEDLRTIIKGSVTAKFANLTALREQLDRDIASSIMIIKKTTPREQ